MTEERIDLAALTEPPTFTAQDVTALRRIAEFSDVIAVDFQDGVEVRRYSYLNDLADRIERTLPHDVNGKGMALS